MRMKMMYNSKAERLPVYYIDPEWQVGGVIALGKGKCISLEDAVKDTRCAGVGVDMELGYITEVMWCE
jgi:hypothetical protein